MGLPAGGLFGSRMRREQDIQAGITSRILRGTKRGYCFTGSTISTQMLSGTFISYCVAIAPAAAATAADSRDVPVGGTTFVSTD